MMTGAISRFAAWLAAIAFVFALTLAATPQLHDRLHNISDTVTHQCAVTLVSSGNCEHLMALSPKCQPDFVPSGPAFRPTRAHILPHAIGSALLEHAPPSLS